MFHFGTALVILAVLGFAYYFTMKWYDLRKKEVAEKIKDVKEIDKLTEDIKDIDIKKTKGKKGKINEFKNI